MPTTPKVNILLVDDHPENLVALQAILEHLDQNLVCASSGAEALRCLLKQEFAVILLDVQMPELDGFETARLIRQRDKSVNTPIVFVTAINKSEEHVARGYAMGAVDYIFKPVVPEILQAKVAAFVALRKELEQRQQSEAKARGISNDLEARIADRTQELGDLYAELQEASRQKDIFLAVLAHELRNPLGAARTGLHVMRSAAPDAPAAARAMDTIERQIAHLTRLVDDLLDLARVEHGKIELRTAPTDINALLRQEAAERSGEAAARQIHLSLEVPEVPVYVLGDGVRLTQVLANLLGNAMKFSAEQSQIVLRLSVDEEKERRARIELCDSGVGISPELLPKLFQPFVQAGASPEGGLGLGLALVKRLVELHGGEVEASSDGLGRGSRFTVLLPLCEQPAAPAQTPVPQALTARSRRVLVIEDNVDAAETLRDLLEISGHAVEVAFTGAAGVAAADSFRPDVVLSDIGLPDMDGYQVAAQLRGGAAADSVVLIALTGNGRDEDKLSALKAGFDLHLTKPVDPAALLRRLRSDDPRLPAA